MASLYAVSRDEARYSALHNWLVRNCVEVKGLPKSYPELRDHLERAGITRFYPLAASEGAPFVQGLNFYGPTFEAAVDTLPASSVNTTAAAHD